MFDTGISFNFYPSLAGVSFTVTVMEKYYPGFLKSTPWQAVEGPEEGVTLQYVNPGSGEVSHYINRDLTLAQYTTDYAAARELQIDAGVRKAAQALMECWLRRDIMSRVYSFRYKILIGDHIVSRGEECDYWFDWSPMDKVSLEMAARVKFETFCVDSCLERAQELARNMLENLKVLWALAD